MVEPVTTGESVEMNGQEQGSTWVVMKPAESEAARKLACRTVDVFAWQGSDLRHLQVTHVPLIRCRCRGVHRKGVCSRFVCAFR